jgi:cyclophilin family peptidyl-prolyl cis-trans isomerase
MEKIIFAAVGVIVVLGGGVWYYSQAASNTLENQIVTATTVPDIATTTSNAPTTTPTPTPTPTQTNTKKIMSATLHTNFGDITIEFLPDQAPNTVANFIKLASSGFYDSTKFHRVIKGFMDQGGDPLTKDDSQMARWGTGGPGYTFNDEISATNSNVADAVAMANSGPNTNGSQFFINAVDNHSLDKNYTVFARVTAGMDVVTAINNVAVDSSDRPLSPVVLENITLQ